MPADNGGQDSQQQTPQQPSSTPAQETVPADWGYDVAQKGGTVDYPQPDSVIRKG